MKLETRNHELTVNDLTIDGDGLSFVDLTIDGAHIGNESDLAEYPVDGTRDEVFSALFIRAAADRQERIDNELDERRYARALGYN